jgi:hypothetical protein
MVVSTAVYRPCKPQAADYYRCAEDHPEIFIRVYDERLERTYGLFPSLSPEDHLPLP